MNIIMANEKDEGNDYDNKAKRNRIISEIRKELRSLSAKIDIETSKCGREAASYKLIVP